MAFCIQTKRLRITPFNKKHISETYLEWLNSPDLMAYSRNRNQLHTLESCAKYANSFDHRASCLWAIEQISDDVHVGNINAYLNIEHGVADIGILIGKSGCGYGLEAWKGVMTVLFNGYQMRKVTGGCISSHSAMLKIMRAADMRPDGVRISHILHEGEPVDISHYACFRSDFNHEKSILINEINA